MLRRSLPLLPLAWLTLAGCRTPTEIVVELAVTGGPPPAQITVQLGRSTPFVQDPPSVPSFVTPSLDDPYLDLLVTPQGALTEVSLLPAASGPTDLSVQVLVDPGYTVAPATAQRLTFLEHHSQQVKFTITAPKPDAGAAPHDAGTHRD